MKAGLKVRCRLMFVRGENGGIIATVAGWRAVLICNQTLLVKMKLSACFVVSLFCCFHPNRTKSKKIEGIKLPGD